MQECEEMTHSLIPRLLSRIIHTALCVDMLQHREVVSQTSLAEFAKNKENEVRMRLFKLQLSVLKEYEKSNLLVGSLHPNVMR